jgi:hypothetical protein
LFDAHGVFYDLSQNVKRKKSLLPTHASDKGLYPRSNLHPDPNTYLSRTSVRATVRKLTESAVAIVSHCLIETQTYSAGGSLSANSFRASAIVIPRETANVLIFRRVAISTFSISHSFGFGRVIRITSKN